MGAGLAAAAVVAPKDAARKIATASFEIGWLVTPDLLGDGTFGNVGPRSRTNQVKVGTRTGDGLHQRASRRAILHANDLDAGGFSCGGRRERGAGTGRAQI